MKQSTRDAIIRSIGPFVAERTLRLADIRDGHESSQRIHDELVAIGWELDWTPADLDDYVREEVG